MVLENDLTWKRFKKKEAERCFLPSTFVFSDKKFKADFFTKVLPFLGLLSVRFNEISLTNKYMFLRVLLFALKPSFMFLMLQVGDVYAIVNKIWFIPKKSAKLYV